MRKERIIGICVFAVFLIIILYFTLAKPAKGEIPDHVTGNARQVYEWAKTPEGKAILEQVPCYCGCAYEGHKHARHCFWDDNGNFDSHATGCSTCMKIGEKAKKMNEEGKTVCEIRKEIDSFFAEHKDLATPTPMPQGCEQLTNSSSKSI